jgi:non-ribosomal peptide synthetase-like protein
LVRSGVDLGPWLIAHGITVVSTVPTLAGLWPAESLEAVRLLIFGGEACPQDLVARLAVSGREVWNTYGPTEATVVSCATMVTGADQIRIGLPLDGWDLAVVDGQGAQVAQGEVGELIIAGVGLARYLDPAKDAEKFAPMPTLGWERAYRSGDLVRYEAQGLIFQGRADDQVKLGGRRIELGEIDAALIALPGVAAAAAVVQSTPAGNHVLVGYLAIADGNSTFTREDALATLRNELPAALVPVLCVVESIPTRTSGKVDRDALPWPLPVATHSAEEPEMSVTASWLAANFTAILGSPVTSVNDDFFALGGGSLSAAQLVSLIRERFVDARVADIYDHPRLGALAAELDSRIVPTATRRENVSPISGSSQLIQTLLGIPIYAVTGARWMTYLMLTNNVLALLAPEGAALAWLPSHSWWWILLGLLVFVSPVGRMSVAVVVARLVLAGVAPGDYPRGGAVHLRVWFVERFVDASGAANLAGAPWIKVYARALGARIAPGVDLHSLPPVTGLMTVGAGSSVEPEVDLSGYWIDGDVFTLGAIFIGADVTIGARSTLLPGSRIGKGAEIEAGSSVLGKVPAGQNWAGSPARRMGKSRNDWPESRPGRGRLWLAVYVILSGSLALLPIVSLAPSLVIALSVAAHQDSLAHAMAWTLVGIPAYVALAGAIFVLLTIASVRLLGVGLKPGIFPVRSSSGVRVWATERVLDSARTLLFPIYASLFTPLWLRLLGARVGRNVEASTVLLLPKMTTIGSEAFLADDTMIASYELGHGWMRIARAKIGRKGFLGNSAMTAPGRAVPKNGLVAVLSSTPRKAKVGTSWLGNPPVRLRRSVAQFDETRTFEPSPWLKLARFLWELVRFVPVFVYAAIGLVTLSALEMITIATNTWIALALSPVVLLGAAVTAAAVTTLAKWCLVGRITVSEHPLWSSFVWRNEVADTFVEMVAAPWFANVAIGTPVLSLWLRTLGAKIGRGVWCETYWLPEADLVTVGDGAVVNRGCVVQTHLFHDRVMQLDTVEIAAGGTLGPHSVILPAASIKANATVGPASLIMRGESVPEGSRWAGNPLATWVSRRP